MKSAYTYGYFQAGYGQARGRRVKMMDRIRLRRRRRRMDDLEGLRRWAA